MCFIPLEQDNTARVYDDRNLIASKVIIVRLSLLFLNTDICNPLQYEQVGCQAPWPEILAVLGGSPQL